jgi:hypothetical protein
MCQRVTFIANLTSPSRFCLLVMASDSTTLLGAMLSFSVLFFATLPRVHVWAQDQNIFVSPKYNPTDKTGIYAGDLQWALGSSQLIAFQSTWDGYRIELWQQSLPTGGAKISSNLVYNRKSILEALKRVIFGLQELGLRTDRAPSCQKTPMVKGCHRAFTGLSRHTNCSSRTRPSSSSGCVRMATIRTRNSLRLISILR